MIVKKVIQIQVSLYNKQPKFDGIDWKEHKRPITLQALDMFLAAIRSVVLPRHLNYVSKMTLSFSIWVCIFHLALSMDNVFDSNPV